ncbi:MAG: AAA family ATPase [Pseudohongiellaceae bacterium]
MSENSFDEQIELPSNNIEDIADTLVGFEARYRMIRGHLQMILEPERIDEWANIVHARPPALVNLMRQRYPLFLLSGDVGTGKTITAECIANRITKEMKREGVLLKLGAQVRGRGLHGEMTQKVRDAFEELKAAAGKKRLAFLVIDEADAVAAQRDTEQMHQEEKSAINTLIQRIDAIRSVSGRAAVFLCTNRIHAIDPAVVRRAALHLEFNRPGDDERVELLTQDLDGLGLTGGNIDTLAYITGPKKDRPGYTYSDFRLRFYPHAVAMAFPNTPLKFDILKKAAQEITPSPEIKKSSD